MAEGARLGGRRLEMDEAVAVDEIADKGYCGNDQVKNQEGIAAPVTQDGSFFRDMESFDWSEMAGLLLRLLDRKTGLSHPHGRFFAKERVVLYACWVRTVPARKRPRLQRESRKDTGEQAGHCATAHEVIV